MITFLEIIGWVLFGIIAAALIVGPVALAAVAWVTEWRSVRDRIHATLILLATLILAIAGTVFIIGNAFPDDNSSHCGTGTRYVEQSHYDVATKSDDTEWWCVAS